MRQRTPKVAVELVLCWPSTHNNHLISFHNFVFFLRCIPKPVINSVNYMIQELRPNLWYGDIMLFFDHQPVFPQVEVMGL